MKIEEKLPALVDVCAHAARALPPTTKISLDEDVLEDLQRVAGPNFSAVKEDENSIKIWDFIGIYGILFITIHGIPSHTIMNSNSKKMDFMGIFIVS